MEYHQINLTGQEIDERLQNVGTPADNPDANGTLFARLNKNVDDVDALNDSVAHIQDEQAATDKTVAKHTADISALQTAVGNNKTEQDAIAQKVQQNAAAIGSVDDPNNAKGSLYARVKKANASTDVNRLAITTLSSANKKNQADITNIDSRQTNIEQVVSGARSEAYFSLRFLNLIVNSEFIADIDNIKVVLYRWSGKRYSELELFTKNGFKESQKIIQYVIILKQTVVNGVNKRTPYIHYNDDATEETLVDALINAFGGRISYRKNKKKRWRLQAFLNGKPITAPFDFRVSIDCNDNRSLTKGGMMRSVPRASEVVYDGYFNGNHWLAHKKGSQFNIVFFKGEETIKRFPMPGDPVSSTGETYGAVVAVKEKPTATAITYNILWTNGVALYEIGVLEEAGVLSYTCTSPAKKLCDDIYDYASKMSSGTLRDQYISAGAVYNEATGYYELNGLTDITEEQMRKIYKYVGTPQGYASHAYSFIRTNFPSPGYYNGSLYNGMFYASKIEVVNLGYRQIQPPTFLEPFVMLEGTNAFYLCQNLRIIYGRIVQSYVTKDWDLTFGECAKLEEVRISKLMTSIKLSWSPNLSKESVQYMIENANPPSGAAAGSITITLHPTAYARLKDDADIVAALEAKEGIVTLVSA